MPTVTVKQLGFFIRFCFSRNITTVNEQTAISFPFNKKNFNCLIERPCYFVKRNYSLQYICNGSE